MFKYQIEITEDKDGVPYYSCVEFKSIDLAVSHLLSAMDCGKTVVFKPYLAPENEI